MRIIVKGLIIIKTRKKMIIISIIVGLMVVFGGLVFYQRNHFNRGIMINGVDVGGLTAKQAADKLKSSKITNNVYIDGKLFLHGKETDIKFNDQDENRINDLLKKQFTLIPLTKKVNYDLGSNQDLEYRKGILKNELQQKLIEQNQNKTASKDAYAELKNGKVTVVKEKSGSRYDVDKMMQEYDRNIVNNKIELKKTTVKPITSQSKTVQKEKQKLTKLSQQEVDYKVEKQTYKLKAAEMINDAKYVNGDYEINDQNLKDKINQINNEQATLGRDFNFKTSNGNEIKVQGKTYGWALSEKKAQRSILKAFEDDVHEVDAKEDIYGIGYGVTSNDGIGDTYAELSLADQHAWFYRDGKLVDQVDVVTGDVKTKAETPKGVYYIMYKQSPSILRGTHPDGTKYESKVTYWAQFTDDGCGFHDAGWRNNWSKTAYLTDGSNGCANIQPSQMKSVYDVLSVNEPVVIY